MFNRIVIRGLLVAGIFYLNILPAGVVLGDVNLNLDEYEPIIRMTHRELMADAWQNGRAYNVAVVRQVPDARNPIHPVVYSYESLAPWISRNNHIDPFTGRNIDQVTVFHLYKPDHIGIEADEMLQARVEYDHALSVSLTNMAHRGVVPTHVTDISQIEHKYSPENGLDLSYQNIEQIDAVVFEQIANRWPNLHFLNLSYTQLTILPDTIDKLQLLLGLDISYTQIMTLPRTISNLKHLISLNLTSTPITTVPYSILIQVDFVKLYNTNTSWLAKFIAHHKYGINETTEAIKALPFTTFTFFTLAAILDRFLA